MSQPADTATRTQHFAKAARAFTPSSAPRHAKLMPMKDGIIELRQNGASLRLIRELLATGMSWSHRHNRAFSRGGER